MTTEEIKKGEEVTPQAPAPTSEPTPPENPEVIPPETPPNIDYTKELEALESSRRTYNPPKSKEEQLRQAKFTLESVKKRITDLGGTAEETPELFPADPREDLKNELY